MADSAADERVFADASRFAELELRARITPAPGARFNAALEGATAGVLAPSASMDDAAVLAIEDRLVLHALTPEIALSASTWFARAGFDPVAVADLPADGDRLRKGGLVVRSPDSRVLRDVIVRVGARPEGARLVAGVVRGFSRFVARAPEHSPEAWGDAIAVAAALG